MKSRTIIVAPRKEYIVTEIHSRPCGNCPSTDLDGYMPDPEVVDILKLPYEERIKTIFPCGWRPWKYCKGYCDLIGYPGTGKTKQEEKR